MKGGWLSSYQPLFCEVALGLASGLHLEIVTENLLPVRSFNRPASCSFLSSLH